MSNSYQGIEDSYLPATPIPAAQKYDNYQIHNFYCRDIIYDNPADSDRNVLFKKFLAVEKVSPYGEIECDFDAIVNQYR